LIYLVSGQNQKLLHPSPFFIKSENLFTLGRKIFQ
jgi:hypothetical protein